MSPDCLAAPAASRRRTAAVPGRGPYKPGIGRSPALPDAAWITGTGTTSDAQLHPPASVAATNGVSEVSTSCRSIPFWQSTTVRPAAVRSTTVV